MSSLELPSVAWLGLNWLGTGGFELKGGSGRKAKASTELEGFL